MPYQVRSTDVWFNAPGVQVAYQSIGAPDPFAARQNVGNDARRPGVYMATSGVAPTWSSATGWGFVAASTQYLDTGVTPANDAYSYMVRYSNAVEGASAVFGMLDSQKQVLILPANAGVVDYRNALGSATAAPVLLAGVLAVTGDAGYRNGVAEVAIGAWGAGTAYSIYLGALHRVASITNYFTGSIQSKLITAITLSPAHVRQYSRQMAYCHVNPDWSAWGRRRRYYYAPNEVAAVRWRGIGRNNTPVSGRISTGRPI